MKDLRVAIFTGNYCHIPDGVSLTLNRWVRYLLDQEIPVLVFAPMVETPQVSYAGEVVSVPSIPIYIRPEYRLTIGFPAHVQARLRSFKPTVAHIATPDWLGFRSMRFSQAHHVQLVASYHTQFASYFRYYKLGLLEKPAWKYLCWFYRQMKHLYVPSPSSAAALARRGIVDNIRIWPRGVEHDLFSPLKRNLAWRRSQGIADESPVIAFVSRLVLEKDLQTVIDTFKQLSAQLPEATVLIVGDGPEKPHMQCSLPGARFCGCLRGEELARAYASADVFFFPSTTETFGNVTLEAMSSGLPAVVADAAGSRDLVEQGVNGFILPPRRTAEFAEHLCLLATHPEIRQRMGHASRQKALHYAWPKVHAGLLANYYEAIADPSVFRLNARRRS